MVTLHESLNNLLMTSQFIASVPAVVYSVVGGGIALKNG
jgi:hypothetical protein